MSWKDDRPYPLDALVIGAHAHSPEYETQVIYSLLSGSPGVHSYGTVAATSANRAFPLLEEGKVNTIFIDPSVYAGWDNAAQSEKFIATVRERFPHVVFVLYGFYRNPLDREKWLASHPRLAHYFTLEPTPDAAAFNAAIEKCQDWHVARFEFDVSISFAGEDRLFARRLARMLTDLRARIFFDEYFRHELLGKDLYAYLHEVYSRRARYCVALISESYVRKIWTNHELRGAQERSLKQGYMEYLLPIRLDESEAPGLMSTIGYLDGRKGTRHVAETVAVKLWPTSSLAAELVGPTALQKVVIAPWP